MTIAIVDAQDSERVELATGLAGEDTANNRLMTMPVYSYAHYTGVAVQQEVKGTPGVLRGVVVNTGVAGQTVTLLDGATAVAVIDAAAAGYYIFDVAMATSILCTPSNAGLDVTVLYL